MSFISFASAPCAEIVARRASWNVCLVAANRIRRAARLVAIVAGAATLAACAQSSVVSKSEFSSGPRQAALERHHDSRVASTGRVRVARKHTPFRTAKKGGGSTGSGGVASFYTEDQETASGEKFDTHDLTAAHPSLPFGTKLRVTNVSTGKSVTVRVNDRGPYVPGRVVDVSYSAAEALGMVDNGLAKVKLDVVH
jgi:peptidoglycan lytic transglycosylase